MCGGGGGGGDGGAAEREAARQDRVSAATAAVNRLFGNGSDIKIGFTKNGQYIERAPNEEDFTTRQDLSNVGGPEMVAAPQFNADAYNQALAEYQAAVSGQGETGQSKASRDAMYSSVRDDTRNYYSKQLEEDRAAAARELKFNKARAGTFGSSQGIDLDTEFQRRLDRGLLDVGNRADSAASGMRSNDEQTRLGLISKITAGMDQGSAASSALAQLKSNAELGRQNAMSGRMANVFADLFGQRNAALAQDGANAAKQQYSQDGLGNYFNSSGDNGTVRQGG